MTGAVDPFIEKMRSAGVPAAAIRNFEHYYRKLSEGASGFIPESEIKPVEFVPDFQALSPGLSVTGREALKRTVAVKLNGGLGTSMGLKSAKSLLMVKQGLSFLDISARQALRTGVPLILMNSFHTREDSLSVLRPYEGLARGLPPDFLQHKVPKVMASDLSPAEWPTDRELEWCPPGHGDIYPALMTSGMLDRIMDAGYRYAFVSNIDNLGAVVDFGILGHFVEEDLPFLMEVSDRTQVDRKGGHLARLRSGGLVLRELAQCSPEDRDVFEGIGRHRFFNTNNLWINLPALKRTLEERDGIMDLPMIRNSKTLDPRDDTSPVVYQLETAMGSAIGVFEAAALRVPRSRFAPVKKTGGLLNVRSDNYVLNEDVQVVPHPERSAGDMIIDLDPDFYRLVDDMEARFPYGPPSLLRCSLLSVRGDVTFGRNVSAEGEVRIVNGTGKPVRIADGATLTGDMAPS